MPGLVTLNRKAIADRYPTKDVDDVLRHAEELLRMRHHVDVTVDDQTGAVELFFRGHIGPKLEAGPSSADVQTCLDEAAAAAGVRQSR